MKLTPWFPADVKPVHEGDYEVKRHRSGGFEKMKPHRLTWDGKGWSYAHDFERAAEGQFALMSAKDGDMWRGLSEPAGCHCSFRERSVGDGCRFCNPEAHQS